MNECPYVEEFLSFIEGKKFIKETNETLKDLKWMEESFEVGMGRK